MRPPGTYILPIVHPAALFRNQTNQFACSRDWEKVVRVQREGPTIVHPPIEEWQWRPTLDHVRMYLTHTWADTHLQWIDSKTGLPDTNLAKFKDLGPWSIDFEATVDRRVVCLGIWSCHEPTKHRGICIPFLSQGGTPYWNPSDQSAVMGLVRDFFVDRARPKIGQNTVGYDTGYPPFNQRSLIKEAWGIDVEGLIGDTMAAHHTCFSELKHSLAFQSSVVTDMGPYKEELFDKEADEDDDDEADWTRILERPDHKVRIYNLKDAFAQAVAWNGLVEEMA